MQFSVKKINGIEYEYLSDTIFIAKGKSLARNISLGKKGKPLSNKLESISTFQQKIIKEEVKARKLFWEPKLKYPKGFEYGLFSQLERLRGLIQRESQKLGSLGQRVMEAAFRTDFIYNSNKIEGSRVPRKTIEEAIRKGVRSNEEVKNSLDALQAIEESKKMPSIRKIVELHKILLAHEPANHGLRKQPIIVGNSKVLEFEAVPAALKELMLWYKEMNHSMYPPELAFEFYYRFERIHPFKDGNGRMGRLLMNFILKEHRYYPIVIWNQNRAAHMKAFEKAIDGGMHKYMSFMASQMDKTYNRYDKKIKKAKF